MNTWLVAVAIVLFLASLAGPAAVTSKKGRFVAVSTIAALWITIAIAVVIYLTNPATRVRVDTVLNPRTTHVWASSTGSVLTLPERTALRFRYSWRGARYHTRLPAADVLAFFRDYTPSDTPAAFEEADTHTEVTVFVGGVRYAVLIIPQSNGGTDLQIDAHD